MSITRRQFIMEALEEIATRARSAERAEWGAEKRNGALSDQLSAELDRVIEETADRLVADAEEVPQARNLPVFRVPPISLEIGDLVRDIQPPGAEVVSEPEVSVIVRTPAGTFERRCWARGVLIPAPIRAAKTQGDDQ